MNVVSIIFGVSILLSSSLVGASGTSIYLPVNISPSLERDIDRLAVLGNIPNLTKPYSVAIVAARLENIKQTYPELYLRIKRDLQYYQSKIAISHVRATLSASDDSVTKPNAQGRTTEERVGVSVRSHWQVNDWIAASLGCELTDENTQASGSLLSFGRSWAQLDIGYKELWLSPFHSSAQMLSTESQTLPSVSLGSHIPIFLGDVGLSYEFLAAQISRQPTLYNNIYSDRQNPLLAGFIVQLHPFDWWSMGATRIFQFGGGERKVSAKTLARAFINPRSADNDASVDEESGNQLAALYSRMNFSGEVPFSLAVELGGEDTSNNKEYQLGNPSLTAGLYFPFFFHPEVSLGYEYASWDSAWYVNDVYQQGYSHENVVLGHWGMQDQHLVNAALPGSSQALHVTWLTSWQHSLNVEIKSVNNKGPQFESAWNIDLEYTLPMRNYDLGLGVFSGKDSFGHDFLQLRVFTQWP